jgi:hypothetical protein
MVAARLQCTAERRAEQERDQRPALSMRRHRFSDPALVVQQVVSVMNIHDAHNLLSRKWWLEPFDFENFDPIMGRMSEAFLRI